jgi:hypothetical protein
MLNLANKIHKEEAEVFINSSSSSSKIWEDETIPIYSIIIVK